MAIFKQSSHTWIEGDLWEFPQTASNIDLFKPFAERCLTVRKEEVVAVHSFQNKIEGELPSKGFIVIRADAMQHFPKCIFDTLTEARAAAARIAEEQQVAMAVIEIKGVVGPMRPKVSWRKR